MQGSPRLEQHTEFYNKPDLLPYVSVRLDAEHAVCSNIVIRVASRKNQRWFDVNHFFVEGHRSGGKLLYRQISALTGASEISLTFSSTILFDRKIDIFALFAKCNNSMVAVCSIDVSRFYHFICCFSTIGERNIFA